MIEFKEFDEAWTSKSRFDMTPMIDMLFLLLIFFLLTSTLSKPVVDVDLPDSTAGRTADNQKIVVAVDSAGSFFLGETAYSGRALAAELAALYKSRNGDEIYISADRKADFGRVVELMDICRAAGAVDISFLVERRPE